MNASGLLSFVLAALCIVAVGVSATTLESTVQTNPDDVIDLDWNRLPLGEGAAIMVKHEMRENLGGDQMERDRGGGGDAVERAAREVGGDMRSQVREAASRASAGGSSESDREPSMIDRLWHILVLLAALALLFVLVLFARRYSSRLSALFGRDREDEPDGGALGHRWPPTEPTGEVDRAWLDFAHRLEVDRPWARTPGEFASAAVEAGMNPDAVSALTTVFREVHYGGVPVTDAHRRRVRRGLRQLDDGGGTP